MLKLQTEVDYHNMFSYFEELLLKTIAVIGLHTSPAPNNSPINRDVVNIDKYAICQASRCLKMSSINKRLDLQKV